MPQHRMPATYETLSMKRLFSLLAMTALAAILKACNDGTYNYIFFDDGAWTATVKNVQRT